MVGTHDNPFTALLLDLEECLHHLHHRHVALEVVGFIEVALAVALRAAKVYEVDAVGKATHHRRQVVVGTHTQRPCAQAEAVGLARHGIDEPLEVVGRRHDAGQAENRHWRVVGMDDQTDASLFGHGAYFLQEIDKVRTETVGIDIVVAVEFTLELLQCEALLRPWQAGYHVAGDELALGSIHLLIATTGLLNLSLRIVFLGAGTLQDEQVEGDEGSTLEAQGPAAVGHLVGQVGACPVEHGHEVIGDDPDAAASEVPQRCLIVIDVALVITCLRLDMFVHRHTFYRRPLQPGSLYHLLPLHDFVHRPHLAVWHMM